MVLLGPPFAELICGRLPLAIGAIGHAAVAELAAKAAGDAALAGLALALSRKPVQDLLAGTIEGSAYLAGLIARDPARLQRILTSPPHTELERARLQMASAVAGQPGRADVMAALRAYKSTVALSVALADLGGIFDLNAVTSALSAAGDAAVQAAVTSLLSDARDRGEIALGDFVAGAGTGYFILAMGKFGANELNYSSDIDLIALFEPSRIRLRDGLDHPTFFARITRDLVRLIHDLTADGYVFRTDFRLRPDPGSTPLAMSTVAAHIYYETVGQNWERAALIKARPCAGDIEAGQRFLSGLAPFIWRRHLDFAAIDDIHAMKRQIHAHRGHAAVKVAGHNIKLGRGGIREVEFFAQTQQLIAGGRQPNLRVQQTERALDALVEHGWIAASVKMELTVAYQFLRRLEHRLQMVGDQQTHTLPADAHGLEAIARLSGYADVAAFERDVEQILLTVERHYAHLFERSAPLTAGGANMVFAGEDDDPGTLAALAKLGYGDPSNVLRIVRGWHRGQMRAVRSSVARERLTDVQPFLIEALGATGDPDGALASFDRFLAELPAGVQLFSLLKANPGLLRLVADIMGSAPRLAHVLSRRRTLLDAVLDPRILGEMPGEAALAAMIAAELAPARDEQEILDVVRHIGAEQAFLIGVRVLRGVIDAQQAGDAYARLAERLIAALQAAVEELFAQTHGRVSGGAWAIVALGKLGGREMTAASDLDLIIVYDHDAAVPLSDGLKPLAASQYYTRLTQRLISALSAPTARGALYEIDLRLRPWGQKGPLATPLASFRDYQAHEAWTWEHMALTRARVLTGPSELRSAVNSAIRAALVLARDRVKIAADVRDMRHRIAVHKGSDDTWDLKHARGGQVDLEFIAQHLMLVSAHTHPEVLTQSTAEAFERLAAAGGLDMSAAATLIPAARLYSDLTQILRLCLDGPFVPAMAPAGLKELLARSAKEPDFACLEARLKSTKEMVGHLFDILIA
jgi:[glutamine synthetase] adenylyltransferase / [glutamine synthetase]-adenylyl-L-tyrosine phosphorylase